MVVLSFPLWRQLFNGSPDMIGRSLVVSGQPSTIVGVAPEWLARTEDAQPLWVPGPKEGLMNDRKARLTDVWGRLKPGVTLAQAQAEMNLIAARLADQHPENAGTTVSVVPRLAHINRQWSAWLWTLLAAVGCLLLITRVNVANLLLARATARQREIALRATLGAGRWRLIRQLLTESLLLAAVGLYGVIAHSVHQRTTEIGIRMVLGAQKSDVLQLILRQGAKLVGIGLALGLIVALGAGRLIESRLYQTSSRDPLTLVSICLFFAGVAALACWFPARRAARIDPIVALRAE